MYCVHEIGRYAYTRGCGCECGCIVIYIPVGEVGGDDLVRGDGLALVGGGAEVALRDLVDAHATPAVLWKHWNTFD